MDRLRRSFRSSFRRKKDYTPESSRPHQWQADEQDVRSGTCSFSVKYLGCVEVFESRGMHVCEEALRVLRKSGRRSIKGTLFVTGDGLRVVDDENKGLLLDQTIEKVSFCAPDRNHDRGFSYICRDGTTRRWMCHGFLAAKDCGDRLSHAVGCAFAVCLERKQRRDKELVSANFDSKTSTFTRTGSFRQVSLTERLTDIQNLKPSESPPIKPVYNPYAIERPHATPQLLQRQGSFRGLGNLSEASPFKRQLSLRINKLPSNFERTRSRSLESSDTNAPPTKLNGTSIVTPIPEVSPMTESRMDSITAMCKEISHGLSLLSGHESEFCSDKISSKSHTIDSLSNSAGPSPPLISSAFASTATTPTPFEPNYPGNCLSSFEAKFDDKFDNNSSNFTLSSFNSAFTTFPKPLQENIAVRKQREQNSCVEKKDNYKPFHSSFNYKSNNVLNSNQSSCQKSNLTHSGPTFKSSDPFDADWVPPLESHQNQKNESSHLTRGTNPFLPNSGSVKTFQIQM